MSKIRKYFAETKKEMLEEVAWPTWKELQANTIIVVVASVLISLFIFVMDFGFGIAGDETSFWRGALGFIYGMF